MSGAARDWLQQEQAGSEAAQGWPPTHCNRPSCKRQQPLQQHLQRALLTLLLMMACSSPCTPNSSSSSSSSSSWRVPGLLLAVTAQQAMPFVGNGDSPPAVPVEVHVTTYLDRLLNVDDKTYEFQKHLPQLLQQQLGCHRCINSSSRHTFAQQQQQQQRDALTVAPHRQRRVSPVQLSRLVLQLLLALLLLLLPAPGLAQQPMPFQGQGDAAPAVPTEVHVSMFVDRLLGVDDRDYSFQAVVWFYLSWRDPRVRGQIAENTAKLTEPNSTYSCELPCQSNQKAISGGCCDGVWMPYIAFSNLKWLPQDRVLRYGFGAIPGTDAVFQWRSVHATFYTPMDLRAFPFDRQQLLIQMEVPQARSGWSGGLVTLLPSTTGKALFTAKTRGDDVSGWGVVDVRLLPFEYPLCQATMAGALGPSAGADPAPVVPQYMWQSQARGNAEECSAVLMSDKQRGRASPFWRHPLANAANVPEMPVLVSGLNCVIVVQRFTTRWVLSAVFPIMATTWLGFLVFFLPKDDMNGRAGSIVALFLALAAIQFVVDSDVPSSSYVTPLQQLTLASYLSLILVGLECVGIWWVTTYHAEKLRRNRHVQAQQQYQEKLTAVREALDAWLAKAQAGYRRISAPSGSSSSNLQRGASRSGSSSLRKAVSRTASKAARGLGLVGVGRAHSKRSSSSTSGEVYGERLSAGGGVERLGSRDHSVAAAAAGPVAEGNEAGERPPAAAAASSGEVAVRSGSGAAGDSSSRRWGSGALRAAQASASNRDGSSSAAEAAANAGTASGAAAAGVAAAEDAAAGEVRLLVAPDAAVAATAAGHASSSPDKQLPQQQLAGLPMQSAESRALSEAAAAAALAAAALAESQVAAAAAAGPPQHRIGPLRFMVQPSSRRASEPGPVPLQQQQTTAAAGGGDVSGNRGPDSNPGLHKRRQQQQQQQADMSDVLPYEVRQPSTAGGVGQVVQDLMGAAQGSRQAGAAATAGAAAAAGGAAEGEAAGQPPPTSWLRKWHVFLSSVANDDAFADRVAHLANKWCAISQLLMYNVAAILIFAINSWVYRIE
uniref:Neurotransmitter-gated ion-channel ligand-binding domain-containing protein n=1 Tax=Tetradesmus obliquus TaxID=3088 RepID=A0A383VCS9_TETOB